MKFDKLKLSVQKLNKSQKQDLINFIKSSYSVFEESSAVQGCPRCGSTHVVKNGTRNKITRYLCRDCSKSFTYKSITILNGIHKINKWNTFVEDFLTLRISSISEISNRLDITRQTALNWRHKLLSAMVSKETTFQNETIEFDEANFLISRKGRQNLGITNRNTYRVWRKSQGSESPYTVKMFFVAGRNSKNIELYPSHMGRTKMVDLENYFVLNKFRNITVYSDSHISYQAYFRRNNIPNELFLSTEHINPDNRDVHNQAVNSYISNFKSFVNHDLKGVSTKYIGFYAKWFQFLTNIKKTTQKLIESSVSTSFNMVEEICKNVVRDYNGLEYYRQSEVSFQQFLRANNRSNWGTCATHYYAV
jgi:transposase-like protein